MRLVPLLSLLLLLLLAGCSPTEPGLRDMTLIEGKWKVVSIEGSDQKEVGKEVFEIKKVGDGWKAYTEHESVRYDVDLRLDTSTAPSTLQLVKDGKVVGAFRVKVEGEKMTWKATDDSYQAVMEKVP
jgi:hypothetical protein